MLLGAVVAFSGWAHPLWFVSLAPLALFVGWRGTSWRQLLAPTLGFVAAFAAALSAFSTEPAYWEPPLFANRNLRESLHFLPHRFFFAMTGNYSNAVPATPLAVDRITTALATAWSLATAVALVRACRLAAARRLSRLEAGLTAGLVANLVFCLFFDPNGFAYRYMLPGVTCAVPLVALTLARVPRRAAAALVSLLVVAGSWSAVEMRRHAGVIKTASMRELLSFLDREQIHAVYSIHTMLPWQIMLASKERVAARWKDPTDRYPAFPRRVDCAVERHERIAVVGHVLRDEPPFVQARTFGGELFAAPGVPVSALVQHGFRIEACEPDSRSAAIP
jgi:hypothetical protein